MSRVKANARARLALGFFAIAALTGVTACGPSYQALYEGEARFERCYALDENATRPMVEKAECWRKWRQLYTYGQNRDRVAYAAGRERVLSRVPALPTDEAMMAAAPGETDEAPRVHAAPAPTNAFAPPPSTLSRTEPPRVAASAAAAPPPSLPQPVDTSPHLAPPGSDCTGRCSREWEGCGAAKGSTCDKAYKKCVGACLR